ncbi:hypothetical protein A7982_13509 [Minicystis rosea]|nr:hypothetical protein A7982_13509 [Minicystis rosea]
MPGAVLASSLASSLEKPRFVRKPARHHGAVGILGHLVPVLPSILALALTAPHLAAARTDRAPKLDGRLDDAVWQKAVPSDAFTQKMPVDDTPPGDRTVVRVLYDDDNVYVGIDCPQTVDVVARLTRRDRPIESDAVTVVLDTRSDGKSAFEFSVNAAGVLSDGLHFNDTEFNPDWDEIWEAEVARTPAGWSAELRIPLRALRFPTRPVQSWGLQIKRYVSMRQELDEWAHIPRHAAGEVSKYGRLDGLAGLKAKTPIELRPFIVGAVRHRDPAATTLARGFEPGFSAGLDLKWHVSQALTLDAAILPDFGQVEADQVFLNLTNYELFYPEKRPFFLEGADVFSTPIQLLYTRRIGRIPPEPALVEDRPIRERPVHAPTPSTIYGAAKLTGELGGGWSIGQLIALTGRQTIDAEAKNGARVERAVDPLSAYNVLRLKRDLGGGAHVGLMLTSVNRLEDGHDYPLLPGHGPQGRAPQLCPSGDEIAAGARCFHDAYVAGVDGRFRSANGEYVLTGQAIATLVDKGPPRTFEDGTVIKSGDWGPAVLVRASKEGGKNLVALAEYEIYGRRVDYNDLGFMLRQNVQRVHTNVEFRTLTPHGPSLETHTYFDFAQRDNLSFQNQMRWFALGNNTKFKNFWNIYGEIHYLPRHFDDREVGDGTALQRSGLFGFEVWLASDQRKRFYAELWTQTRFIENGFSFTGEGKISVKILPQWDFDLLPTWFHTFGEPRYFDTRGAAHLFGRQRAQSLGLTLRSTYTFLPRLTLQAYAQAFLEAVHFSDYTWAPAKNAGAAIRLSDLRPVDFPILENPDYRSGTINASLVLRWEYRLGSTAYLVYTHAQNRSITPRFGDDGGYDFGLVKPRAAEDALILKLSYWWG